MVDTTIILDPAHGKDTPGKRSPDGRLEEWKWSRDRIAAIFLKLDQEAKGFDVAIPLMGFSNEPGLHYRVDSYNQYRLQYKTVIVLSLHVDAFGTGKIWMDPNGFTIFTSRGETDADDYATIIGQALKRQLPEERWRFDFGLSRNEMVRDLDREANFTILAGYKRPDGTWQNPKYHGILIENNFMTNRHDVKKLLDPEWNEKLEEAYVKAILYLAAKLGKAPDYNLTI